MDESERQSLREAAEGAEGAHFRVTELLATAHQGFSQTQPDQYLTPREMATLREVDANLRQACERLWSMCEAASGGSR
jgi:hypothetical protein